MPQNSEPIFNVPGIVLAIIGVWALVLAGETMLLTNSEKLDFVTYFGFIPARYDDESLPGGAGAAIWTFVTYAFVHVSVVHLGMNAIWFLPFGAAVARRFGSVRAVGFFAVTSAGGAALHVLTHWGASVPLIGASAASAGFMAGAIRFAFQHGGPLAMFHPGEPADYFVPAQPLSSALRNPNIVFFVLIWFVLNVLFGLATGLAWEAAVGGFLAGLLLFPLFDPVAAKTA